jgi:Kef-type K+ transport system membrane component KefB
VLLDTLLTLRNTFYDHIVFSLGILLIAGYVLGKLSEKVRLPAITGFIIAGLLLGESFTGIIHVHMVKSLVPITEVALGIIALTIGGEFSSNTLRRTGRGVVIITLLQIVTTFTIVAAGLWILRLPLPYSLLLGAIASATAPAATVAIVRGLRIRGEFVDYLYGIVALDDAGCIILFSIVYAFVCAMSGNAGDTGILSHVGIAFFGIGVSLLIGLAGGLITHIVTRRRQNSNELMILSVGIIFITTAIAISLKVSPLICDMTMGCVLVNLSRRNERIFRVLEPITPPLYAAFFALAGTELKLSFLSSGTVLLLGLAYIILRMAGKYSGVYVGSLISRASPGIRKYLGFSMFPQAGVAIGLILFIQSSPHVAGMGGEAGQYLLMMVNIVLFSVFINELVGPPLSKFGIVRGSNV